MKSAALLIAASLTSVAYLGCDPPSPVISDPYRQEPTPIASSIGRRFLMPFLPGVGTAIACEREEAGGLEQNLLQNPIGVPFKVDEGGADHELTGLSPSYPDIAVWSDRTIVWSQQLPGNKKAFWIGKVSQQKHDAVLKYIATLMNNASRVKLGQMPAASNVTTSLSIADSDDLLVLHSELHQMDVLKSYWHYNGDRFAMFPMDKYSFDDFCAQLPGESATYLRECSSVHNQLRALIPDQGEKIEVNKTIEWVVQEGRKLGPIK